MPRVITARGTSLCQICKSNVTPGHETAHRPNFGYVHYPKCFSAPVKASAPAADLDDLIEDADETPVPANETPDEMARRAAREGLGLPAQTSESSATVEAIEAKVFAELKRALTDQNRLVKASVKGELRTAFDESLPELLRAVTEQVKAATAELVKLKLADAEKEFKTQVARAIAKIAGSGVVRQELVITRPDKSHAVLTGEVYHPRFDWICKLAAAGKPIFLPGPTGCGKTHLASQLARALHGEKWQDKFGILSCSPATAERHFLGRSIPNITTGQDVYRAAEFVNIYENGGVFCADEIDAADASVLLVFNAALANGYLPVPDRTAKPIAHRHPDFTFIACANTWGRGADRRYVGRNPLDEATLDRFRIGTVPLNYSPAIERAKCPDVDLFDTLTNWRAKIMSERLERVLSTRFFGDAYDMLAGGAAMDDITRAFFSGWRPDEVRKVYGKELELD